MSNHSKQQRIFVDCHVFDEGFQGTRTYIEGLYKELIKDTTKHFYLAAGNVVNLEKIFGTHSNVTFLKYKIESKIFRLLFYCPWLILINKINFAHFQYRVPPLKFCRYIVTIHDVLFEDFPEYFPKLNRKISYLTYKFSAKYSEIVLTVSPYAKGTIIKHLGVKNVAITPNGIADTFYESYNKAEIDRQVKEKFNVQDYFIYISRWEPRKNHHLIVKTVMEHERFKKYKLVFVGDTTFKNQEYDVLYSNLNKEDKNRIVSLSRVSFQDAILLLRGARLSIYPSVAEGFGIPPLEAIAAGIPTLSANTTAMADYMDFMGKYQFNPYSETEFLQKLDFVLNEESNAAFEPMKSIIKERYNWKKAADAYIAALKKYIAE